MIEAITLLTGLLRAFNDLLHPRPAQADFLRNLAIAHAAFAYSENISPKLLFIGVS